MQHDHNYKLECDGKVDVYTCECGDVIHTYCPSRPTLNGGAETE